MKRIPINAGVLSASALNMAVARQMIPCSLKVMAWRAGGGRMEAVKQNGGLKCDVMKCNKMGGNDGDRGSSRWDGALGVGKGGIA